MAKIRDDLEGSVMLAGRILRAGDTVPVGVSVDVWVLAPTRRRKGAKNDSMGSD